MIFWLKHLKLTICLFNVTSQFHQHYTSNFCNDSLLQKNYKAKLQLNNRCSRLISKMLSILTLGVKFHQHFTCPGPKSAKKTQKIWLSFCAFGICTFKGFINMLVKSTLGLNFINVLSAALMLLDPKSIKRHWWLNCIFDTVRICTCKSCLKNVDEIDTCLQFHQH